MTYDFQNTRHYKYCKLWQNLVKTACRGEHWGVLNTAIPQKNLPNTAISQKKSPNTAILQYCVETQCHTETVTLYIKFRANNTETEINIWKCAI